MARARLVVPYPAPYDSLFDDAWLKWGWAVRHGVALKAELERELSPQLGETFTTATEYHPEFHGFSLFVSSVERYPETWGLQLGDVLHGYRSALDAAAWAMVKRGTKPPDKLKERDRRRVSFPCVEVWPVGEPKPSWNVQLPGVRPTDLARVRWCQPADVPRRQRTQSVLRYVVEQNNIDKHKTIRPVEPGMINFFDFKIMEATNCIVRRIVPTRDLVTFKVDTELARVYVRRTGPNPDVKVYGQIQTTMFCVGVLPTEMFFERTRDGIADVLNLFSARPPDLEKRLRLDNS